MMLRVESPSGAPRRAFQVIDAPRPEPYDLHVDPFEAHNLAIGAHCRARYAKRPWSNVQEPGRLSQRRMNELPAADNRALLAPGYVSGSPPTPTTLGRDPKDFIEQEQRHPPAAGHAMKSRDPEPKRALSPTAWPVGNAGQGATASLDLTGTLLYFDPRRQARRHCRIQPDWWLSGGARRPFELLGDRSKEESP